MRVVPAVGLMGGYRFYRTATALMEVVAAMAEGGQARSAFEWGIRDVRPPEKDEYKWVH